MKNLQNPTSPPFDHLIDTFAGKPSVPRANNAEKARSLKTKESAVKGLEKLCLNLWSQTNKLSLRKQRSKKSTQNITIKQEKAEIMKTNRVRKAKSRKNEEKKRKLGNNRRPQMNHGNESFMSSSKKVKSGVEIQQQTMSRPKQPEANPFPIHPCVSYYPQPIQYNSSYFYPPIPMDPMMQYSPQLAYQYPYTTNLPHMEASFNTPPFRMALGNLGISYFLYYQNEFGINLNTNRLETENMDEANKEKKNGSDDKELSKSRKSDTNG